MDFKNRRKKYIRLSSDLSNMEKVKRQAEKMDERNIQQNKKFFTEKKFWDKVGKYAKNAGATVIHAVLILFYTLQKPEVPLKVKATIMGALGYFILPLDLLPDFALGAGYVDDLGVITAALIQVAMYVDEEVKNKAKHKLSEWFGENIDTSEIDKKLP